MVELQHVSPYTVLKDLNWAERNRKLESGSIKKDLFPSQLHKDIALLSKLSIMGYSLLLGTWISVSYLVSKMRSSNGQN